MSSASNRAKIPVALGNLPFNANEQNENDNNKNPIYPYIDRLIKDTYITHSSAQKIKVYDMYSRFFRWATDRLGEDGVITNNSFVKKANYDGFRKITASNSFATSISLTSRATPGPAGRFASTY